MDLVGQAVDPDRPERWSPHDRRLASPGGSDSRPWNATRSRRRHRSRPDGELARRAKSKQSSHRSYDAVHLECRRLRAQLLPTTAVGAGSDRATSTPRRRDRPGHRLRRRQGDRRDRGARSAGRVLGIDQSRDMVRRALERHAPRHANLDFEVGDASHLRFDGEFTVVFSNATLHWIRDHRPVLSGIARSLRTGGSVLLQMGGKGNAAEVVEVMEEVTAFPGGGTISSISPFRTGSMGRRSTGPGSLKLP